MVEGLSATTLPGVTVLLLPVQLSTVQATADCAAITRLRRHPPAKLAASLLDLNCFMRRDSLKISTIARIARYYGCRLAGCNLGHELVEPPCFGATTTGAAFEFSR